MRSTNRFLGKSAIKNMFKRNRVSTLCQTRFEYVSRMFSNVSILAVTFRQMSDVTADEFHLRNSDETGVREKSDTR